jgi:hypothetical protein
MGDGMAYCNVTDLLKNGLASLPVFSGRGTQDHRPDKGTDIGPLFPSLSDQCYSFSSSIFSCGPAGVCSVAYLSIIIFRLS